MSEFFGCKAAVIGTKAFINALLPHIYASMGERTKEPAAAIAIEESALKEGLPADTLQALCAKGPELIFLAPPPCAAPEAAGSFLALCCRQLRQAGSSPLLLAFSSPSSEDSFQNAFEPKSRRDSGEARTGQCVSLPLTVEKCSEEEAAAIRQITGIAIRAAAESRESSPGLQAGFSPKHQAVLFGLLARDILSLYGRQRGDQLLKRAVRRYGNERGSRMAQRALQNGDPLDMTSYFAYGEWSWAGDFSQTVIQKKPYYIERVYGCPWYTGWEESGLAEYGWYYCRSVDASLLEGFQPALRLEVPAVCGISGCSYCEFHWKDAAMTPEAQQRQQSLAQRLGGSCKKDFVYHTAHLYSTLTRCAREEQPQIGRQLIRHIWQEFSEYTSCWELWQVLAQADAGF